MLQTDLFTFNEVQVIYNSTELGPEIRSSRDAYEHLIDRWQNIDYCEKFYVIMLNRANRILGIAFISEGSVGGTVADPKKIFQIALKANASSILICHYAKQLFM
jgi:DNA repair protein RadC